VASEPLTFALLHRDGGEPHSFIVDDPASLLREAVEASAALGLAWESAPVKLMPTPKLAHLIKESRKLKVAGEGGDDDGAE
jgi:CRISPR-associated protein Csb1